MKINLPQYIQNLISMLECNGFEAYAVGGCVRNALLGIAADDYDITTSAFPEDLLAVFSGMRVVETGIRHGTITVVCDEGNVEITTYRIDGEYTDNRHPDAVKFTRNIHEDLKRRDFTVNAMAYNPRRGLIDLFGGAEDISKKIIRCVGEPTQRFNEDALRIMRALRFSSVLGFEIDKETSEAIHKNKGLLDNISSERISSELKKLICGNCEDLLMEYSDVISQIIPEITPCIGFRQNSKYHCYDVYKHICVSVGAAEKNDIIRLTMLLHDIGKPECYQFYDGHGHFKGHQEVSAAKANKILKRLRFDGNTIAEVTELIRFHDMPINDDLKGVRRHLFRFGENMYKNLIKVHIADDSAKAAEYRNRIEIYNNAVKVADEIIEKNKCFNIRQLAVNGNDLSEINLKGREIGEMLTFLVESVIDEKCENSKNSLILYAEKYKNTIQKKVREQNVIS